MSVQRRGVAILTRPEEYAGQTTVAIGASQMDGLTGRQQARLLDDWSEFFATGPTDIWDLAFPMRMPKRLFDSLATQTQLRRLAVSWGVYDDLTALVGMGELLELELESATSVTTLEPLRALTRLESLDIGGAWRVHDYSAIGALTNLRQLSLGGGSEKRQHVASLEFLVDLRQLARLQLSLVPDRLDYSPILAMTWVEEMDLWTLETHRKRMAPSMIDLEWALPGLQRRRSDVHAGRSYEWERGARVGEHRMNDDGEWNFHRYDLEGDD